MDPSTIVLQQVIHRRVVKEEEHFFCLRCRWSVPHDDEAGDALVAHLTTHPGSVTALGVDWAIGSRYAPMDGCPRRGVPNHLEVSPRTVGLRRFPHGTMRKRRRPKGSLAPSAPTRAVAPPEPLYGPLDGDSLEEARRAHQAAGEPAGNAAAGAAVE